MDLKQLKQEIPFKWRVQSANQYGAKCVAYIDARDVQDLLDEVCGADKWQLRYREHLGETVCEIGIHINDEWIWKAGGGDKTDFEAFLEKKKADFSW